MILFFGVAFFGLSAVASWIHFLDGTNDSSAFEISVGGKLMQIGKGPEAGELSISCAVFQLFFRHGSLKTRSGRSAATQFIVDCFPCGWAGCAAG